MYMTNIGKQVVLNLIKNAAEAIDNAKLPPSRRHIELRVVPRHLGDEGAVIEFSVSDMGPGIKEEVLTRLYEAFFSTKPEGLGMGLAISMHILQECGGSLRAFNLEGRGLCVEIRLMRAPGPGRTA